MRNAIVFDIDGQTVMQAITVALTQYKFYVMRSFDLRSTVTAHRECPCPIHGTADCPCEFVVLLVYGEAPEPVVLTTHCRDGQTAVRLVRDAVTIPDPHLAEQVMDVLMEVGLALHFAPKQKTVTGDAPQNS